VRPSKRNKGIEIVVRHTFGFLGLTQYTFGNEFFCEQGVGLVSKGSCVGGFDAFFACFDIHGFCVSSRCCQWFVAQNVTALIQRGEYRGKMGTAGCTYGNNVGFEVDQCLLPVGGRVWNVHIGGDLFYDCFGTAGHSNYFDTVITQSHGMTLTCKTRA
jgi:hypothetical protein